MQEKTWILNTLPNGVPHYNDTQLGGCILRFLLDINYLQYPFFIKTMHKKIMDF